MERKKLEVSMQICLFQLVFKSIWLQDLLIQPRLRRGLDHPLLILLFYIYSKGLDHPNLHSRPAWVYHLLDHGLQKWWRIIYQFKVQIKDTNIIFVLWPVWIHNMQKKCANAKTKAKLKNTFLFSTYVLIRFMICMIIICIWHNSLN